MSNPAFIQRHSASRRANRRAAAAPHARVRWPLGVLLVLGPYLCTPLHAQSGQAQGGQAQGGQAQSGQAQSGQAQSGQARSGHTRSGLAQRGHVESGPAPDIDLFALTSANPGAALPAGWQTRAVRGQRLPMSRLVDTSGIRYMRVSGQGQAGWFVRELPVPLIASAGRLHWMWRAPLAPRGANVAVPSTDDATLRVFVVFGLQGRFERRPRVLFYTLADGDPAPDRPDRPFGVRIAGRPALARDWVHATADPFLDYRRIWGSEPRQIIAIGVMQDTDQTRSAAIGDVMNLSWRSEHAAPP